MMKWIWILFLLPVLGWADTVEQMTREMFENATGALPYRAITVGESAKKPALLIFLHGSGERGDDNEAQLKHGVKDLLAWLSKSDEHATVIVPQCHSESTWAPLDGVLKGEPFEYQKTPTRMMKLLLALIDERVKSGEVDNDRVYITGLSMGGFGTFEALARRPELFAAAAPVCGGGDPQTVPKMKGVPFWVFHGDADEVVSVGYSQVMVGALLGAENEIKYTQYPEVGHDSWTATYQNSELWKWLFSKRKP